jgi:protein N-lysine methyltransferase METTL21A
VVWDSAVCLARFLTTHHAWLGINPLETSVLELGTGCGLVGLVLTRMARRVVVTDQDVEMVIRNVRRNGARDKVEVVAFDWGDAVPMERVVGLEGVDVVVASDCVYNDVVAKEFARVLERTCEVAMKSRGKKTVVVLAQELRSDSVHLDFLEEWAKRFCIYRMLAEKDFEKGYVIYIGWLNSL